MKNPIFEAAHGLNISIPSAVARTVKPGSRYTDPDELQEQQQQPEQPKPPGLMPKIGTGALNAVAAVGNTLDLPGSSVRDILSGKNPLDQWLDPFGREADKNRTSGQQMLKRAGIIDDKDNWKNFLLGMGTEIVLDPTTYVGVGALSRAGVAFKNAGVSSKTLRPLAKEIAETGGSKLGNKTVNARSSSWIGGKMASFTQTPNQIFQHAERLLQKKIKPSLDGTIDGTFKAASDDGIAFTSKADLDKISVPAEKAEWAIVDEGGRLSVYKNAKESTEWTIDAEASRLANQAISQTATGATPRTLYKRWHDAHRQIYGKNMSPEQYKKLRDQDLDAPLRSLASVGLPFARPFKEWSASNPEERWGKWLDKQPELPEGNQLDKGPPPSGIDIPPTPPKDPPGPADPQPASPQAPTPTPTPNFTVEQGKEALKTAGIPDLDIDAIGDENILKEVARYGLVDSKGRPRVSSFGKDSKANRAMHQAARVFGPRAVTAFPVVEALAKTWGILNGKNADEYFDSLSIAFGDTGGNLGKWGGEANWVKGADDGVVRAMRTGERVIKAMMGTGDKAPSVATFIHEVGHDARMMFSSKVQKQINDAMEAAWNERYFDKATGKTTKRMYDEAGQWTDEAEELFANSFEAWNATGKAPTGLKKVFEDLKEWIKATWKSIKGEPALEKFVHEDMKKLFEEMTSGASKKAKDPFGIKPPTAVASANAADAVDGQLDQAGQNTSTGTAPGGDMSKDPFGVEETKVDETLVQQLVDSGVSEGKARELAEKAAKEKARLNKKADAASRRDSIADDLVEKAKAAGGGRISNIDIDAAMSKQVGNAPASQAAESPEIQSLINRIKRAEDELKDPKRFPGNSQAVLDKYNAELSLKQLKQDLEELRAKTAASNADTIRTNPDTIQPNEISDSQGSSKIPENPATVPDTSGQSELEAARSQLKNLESKRTDKWDQKLENQIIRAANEIDRLEKDAAKASPAPRPETNPLVERSSLGQKENDSGVAEKTIKYSDNPEHNADLNRIHQSLSKAIGDSAAAGALTKLVKEFVEAGNDPTALKTTIESMSPEDAVSLAADAAIGDTSILMQKMYTMLKPEDNLLSSVPGKPSSLNATEVIEDLLLHRGDHKIELSIGGRNTSAFFEGRSHSEAELALAVKKAMRNNMTIDESIDQAVSRLYERLEETQKQYQTEMQGYLSKEDIEFIEKNNLIKTTSYTSEEGTIYDAYLPGGTGRESVEELAELVLAQADSEEEAIRIAMEGIRRDPARAQQATDAFNKKNSAITNAIKDLRRASNEIIKVNDQRPQILEVDLKNNANRVIESGKLVSEQSPEVLKSLSKLPIKISSNAKGRDIVNGLVRHFIKKNTGRNILPEEAMEEMLEDAMRSPFTMTDEEILAMENSVSLAEGIYQASKDASKALSDAGIVGMYSPAQKTREYSTFSTKEIKQIIDTLGSEGRVSRKAVMEFLRDRQPQIAESIQSYKNTTGRQLFPKEMDVASLRRALDKLDDSGNGHQFLKRETLTGRKSKQLMIFDDEAFELTDTLLQGEKGLVRFLGSGEAAVKIVTGKGDASTAVHELSHVFRRNLRADLMERAEGEIEKALQDPDVIKNILGGNASAKLLNENGKWTREAEEVWARLFEKYIREGTVPKSSILKEAFDTIKKMMIAVYKTVRGSEIDGKISPDLKAVFDDMLGIKQKSPGKRPSAKNPILDAAKASPAPTTPEVRTGDPFGDTPVASQATDVTTKAAQDFGKQKPLPENALQAAAADKQKTPMASFEAAIREQFKDRPDVDQIASDFKAIANALAKASGKSADDYLKGEFSRVGKIQKGEQLKSSGEAASETLYQNEKPAGQLYYKTERMLDDGKVGGRVGLDQFKATAKKYGVKDEELDDLNINELFKDGKAKTPQEIRQWVQQNQVMLKDVETNKYAGYQVPGGVEGTYREKLITAPNSMRAPKETPGSYEALRKFRENMHAKYGNGWANKLSSSEGEEYSRILNDFDSSTEAKDLAEEFKFLQRDIENGLNDENQLRRYEELKAMGFEDKPEYLGPHFDSPNVLAHVRMDDIKLPNGKKALRVQEVQSDWHQAGKKTGYDTQRPQPNWTETDEGLEWTIDSNDGSVVTTKITPSTRYDGMFELRVGDTGVGAYSTIEEAKDQAIHGLESYGIDTRNYKVVPDGPFKKSWTELALKKILLEAAEKGYDEVHIVKGSDIQQAVRGSEKLPRFYDEELHNDMKKLTKRWGSFQGIGNNPKGINAVELPWGQFAGDVQVFSITPKMRQDLLEEGLPLYQKRGSSARGAVSFDSSEPDAFARVFLSQSADVSTVAHELAHIARRRLDGDLLKEAESVYGVKSSKWTVAQEESFAKDFETYLATGKSPVPDLESVFARMKQWLAEVYSKITNSPLGKKLTDDQKQMFDAIFGNEEAKAAIAKKWNPADDLVGKAKVISETADATSLEKLQRAAQVGARAEDRIAISAVDMITGARSTKKPATKAAQEVVDDAPQHVKDAEAIFGPAKTPGQRLTGVGAMKDDQREAFEKLYLDLQFTSDKAGIMEELAKAASKAAGRQLDENELAKAYEWLNKTDSQFRDIQAAKVAEYKLYTDALRPASAQQFASSLDTAIKGSRKGQIAKIDLPDAEKDQLIELMGNSPRFLESDVVTTKSELGWLSQTRNKNPKRTEELRAQLESQVKELSDDSIRSMFDTDLSDAQVQALRRLIAKDTVDLNRAFDATYSDYRKAIDSLQPSANRLAYIGGDELDKLPLTESIGEIGTDEIARAMPGASKDEIQQVAQKFSSDSGVAIKPEPKPNFDPSDTLSKRMERAQAPIQSSIDKLKKRLSKLKKSGDESSIEAEDIKEEIRRLRSELKNVEPAPAKTIAAPVVRKTDDEMQSMYRRMNAFKMMASKTDDPQAQELYLKLAEGVRNDIVLEELPKAKAAASKMANNPAEADEMMTQLGGELVTMVEKQDYTKSKRISWSLLQRRMLDIKKKEGGGKSQAGKAQNFTDSGDTVEAAQRIEASIVAKDSIEPSPLAISQAIFDPAVDAKLSEKQKAVINLMREGKLPEEHASKLGMTREEVQLEREFINETVREKAMTYRELFKSAPQEEAVKARIAHKIAEAEWKDIFNHIKGEDATQTLLQALDVGGTLMMSNPATRTFLKMFDAEVMGTGTYEEQEIARKLYRAHERAIFNFREIMHPIVHYTGRSHLFNQKLIATDLINSGMEKTAALKEAAKISNARNAEIRKYMEFNHAPANAGQKYTLQNKGVFDIPDADAAKLESWLDSLGDLLKDAITDSKLAGLSAKELMDEMINYAPRHVAQPGRSALQKRTNQRLMDASEDAQIGREDFLKNLPGGTGVLDTMSLDEAISGIYHDQAILGKGLDEANMAKAMAHIEQHYIDDLLTDDYFDEAGKLTDEGRSKLGKIASFIGTLPKSHIEQQVPVYGNNFLRDLSMYFETNYMKRSVALAAQELAIRNITAGGEKKYLLDKFFGNARMDNHQSYMNVIRGTGRLGDYQNFVKERIQGIKDLIVDEDGMIVLGERKLSPAAYAEELNLAKEYAVAKELGVSEETFDAANYWLTAFMRPKVITEVKQVADTMLNAFKSMVTVPFLSFHGRNKFSGAVQNYFFDAYDPTAPVWDRYTKTERQALALRNGSVIRNISNELPENLVDEIVKKSQEAIQKSGDEVIELTAEQKDSLVSDWIRSQVFKYALVGDRMGVTAERIGDTVSSLTSQSPGTVVKNKDNWYGFKQPITDPTTSMWDKANPIAFGGSPYMAIDKSGARPKLDVRKYEDTTNVIGGIGHELGAMVEETNRISPFLAFLKQGMVPEEAAKMTHMTQFDYSKLTDFERSIKGWVPFYTFSSRALALTLSDLLTNPGGKQAWSIRAAARAQDTDEPMPEHIRRGIAIPLGKGEDGESRYISGLGLAWEEPLEMMSFLHGDGKSTMASVLTKLRPEAQAVGEMAMGRSLFFDREFSDMDPQLGRLRDNLLGREQKGLAEPLLGSESLEFFVGKTPATRLVSTANKAMDERKNALEKFLNLATGIKVTDINAEAAERLRMNEAVRQLKELGAREMSVSYLPDWQKERMTPEQLRLSQELQAMINSIKAEQRERKKVAQLQSLKAGAESGSE